MPSPTEFKIIIVGGGVAGLTLANMLEKFGLDYVLLESHEAIAPQVGASIGLFPNGLRILDQIGIHDEIKDVFKGNVPYAKTHSRNQTGKVVSTIGNMSEHLEKRHGYGLLFFDRQVLLQILYDNIQDKSKILTGQKFSSAELDDDGVTAVCTNGSTYRGTFLIGADGIHSKVRTAMRSWGNKYEPGVFDEKEEDEVPCYYKCSFGIAVDVPNWVGGEQHIVTGLERSQLVVSGPDNRVYWFLFEKLPEPRYGKDIPRYSKKDEEDFVNHNANLPITESITFGQVFACRLTSTLTPLHEVAYKKWFFRRFITFGDSAHKPNPIGGQGGNGAIESCAELINALLETKKNRGDSLSNLTTEEIEDVFAKMQNARYQRAKEIVVLAHKMQALNAYENPLLSTVVLEQLGPLAGPESVLCMMGKVLLGGTRIKTLPIPKRPRLIPYNDELPAVPIEEDSVSWLVRGGQLASMAALILISAKAFRLPFDEIAKWAAEEPIVIRWFGQGKASDFLNSLVSVLAILVEHGPATRLQVVNFLFQLVSPLLIYTIEANRVGNQGTPLALDLLYSFGMQVQGIGRIGPLHAALQAVFTHERPTGRHVPVETAKALIPAITLGYVIPTIMVFARTPNTVAWQHALALWQFAPPLVGLLTRGISSLLKSYQRGIGKSEEDDKDGLERYKNTDVPILNSVYTYAFAAQATVHIASMLYAWAHPELSIFKTFFQVPNPFKPDWNLPTVGAKLGVFFKYDMLLASAASIASGLYSIWDLRRLGYVETKDALIAGASTIAGQLLVGPGATWAGLWYWRENRLAGLTTRRQ
ncbi:unnamed protein product [Clonostachys rhizophaga]|uniref:FAD-binding domain-containing protein n=1 Tax=Clonostachys rhizophaga TaxID=160324 RepID=A0A9N9VHG2_9HYPO|nr:unnamed protein product [Clonostachys rhizophaga]